MPPIRDWPRSAKPTGSKALQTYEEARSATTPEGRKGVLDSFAAATDNWTRSALVAAATEQAATYVTEALTYGRPTGVGGLRRRRAARRLAGPRRPAADCGCRSRARHRHPQIRHRPGNRADGRRIPALRTQRRPKRSRSCSRTLRRGRGVLPIVAAWDKGGALTSQGRYPGRADAAGACRYDGGRRAPDRECREPDGGSFTPSRRCSRPWPRCCPTRRRPRH